eukprot:COSAG02_NODE_603_length_19693_cov_3.883944_11_plen_67_part_00
MHRRMHEAAHKYAVKQFLLKNAPQDGGGGDRPAMLEGWDFKARNQLIWNPSGTAAQQSFMTSNLQL